MLRNKNKTRKLGLFDAICRAQIQPTFGNKAIVSHVIDQAITTIAPQYFPNMESKHVKQILPYQECLKLQRLSKACQIEHKENNSDFKDYADEKISEDDFTREFQSALQQFQPDNQTYITNFNRLIRIGLNSDKSFDKIFDLLLQKNSLEVMVYFVQHSGFFKDINLFAQLSLNVCSSIYHIQTNENILILLYLINYLLHRKQLHLTRCFEMFFNGRSSKKTEASIELLEKFIIVCNIDVNKHFCLHHAISNEAPIEILEKLIQLKANPYLRVSPKTVVATGITGHEDEKLNAFELLTPRPGTEYGYQELRKIIPIFKSFNLNEEKKSNQPNPRRRGFGCAVS